MKKRNFIFSIGVFLLSFSNLTACPIYLYSSIDYTGQKTPRGSRAPKRPISVNFTDQTLTVPNWLIGYILVLEDEEGAIVYTCPIKSNNVVLPFENIDNFKILKPLQFKK